MARMVQCIKLNKEAEGLEFAPVPGELGKKIWQQEIPRCIDTCYELRYR